MRSPAFIAAIAAVLTIAALAQSRAAPPPPYKPVAIALPQPVADDSFDAMRKQIGEAAQRKDRAALTKLVVARGFFWQRDNRVIVLERLGELVRRALVRPPRRRKTRPSRAARERRLQSKKQRGELKSLRKDPAR